MKKSFVLCLAIVMCLFAVTGSIAYFTDSVQANGNVVQSGNLDIIQAEFERGTGNVLQTYSQNQAIYPSVGTLQHPIQTSNYTYKITDEKNNTTDHSMTVSLADATSLRGFVDKIVVVKNNGTLPVYVRTFVAVPASFNDAIVLDWNTSTSGWTEPVAMSGSYDIDGTTYTIWYTINTNSVASGASAPPSLLGFYPKPEFKNENNDVNLKILVATQASQVIPTGIGENTTRMDALSALTETYDEVSTDENNNEVVTIRHPWMTETK